MTLFFFNFVVNTFNPNKIFLVKLNSIFKLNSISELAHQTSFLLALYILGLASLAASIANAKCGYQVRARKHMHLQIVHAFSTLQEPVVQYRTDNELQSGR